MARVEYQIKNLTYSAALLFYREIPRIIFTKNTKSRTPQNSSLSILSSNYGSKNSRNFDAWGPEALLKIIKALMSLEAMTSFLANQTAFKVIWKLRSLKIFDLFKICTST